MAHIDEIISSMEESGDLTIAEISAKTGIPTGDVSITLREAEIKGLVYRRVDKEKETYKL